eukprot:911588_1
MTESEDIKDVVNENHMTKGEMEKKKHTSQSGSQVIGLCDDHFQKDKKEKEQSRKRKHPESEPNDASVNNDSPRKKRKIDEDNKQQSPSTTHDDIVDDIVLTREQILNKIEFLQLPLLLKFNNHLQHAFFTRNGGVSTDEGVQSLNVLFSKEDHKNVFENRLRITQLMTRLTGMDTELKLVSLVETHSNKVIHVTDKIVSEFNPPSHGIPKADGMVTQLKNVVLAIYAADCCPIFFYDPNKQILGACHAGYKGALNGIMNNTIKEMVKLGSKASDIYIGIGPALQQASSEVSIDFKDQYAEECKVNERFFIKSLVNPESKLLFDYVAYIKSKLIRDCGIAEETHIECSDVDTFTDHRFYSYRRSHTLNEKKWGNHMSCAVMF